MIRQARAAARASISMRRAATAPFPASPATFSSSGFVTIARVAASIATSAAATAPASNTARRSRETVPSSPGRSPWIAATSRTRRKPRQAKNTASSEGEGTTAVAAKACAAAVRPAAVAARSSSASGPASSSATIESSSFAPRSAGSTPAAAGVRAAQASASARAAT
jgi:hypothetical protein